CVVIPSRADDEGPRRRSVASAKRPASPLSDARRLAVAQIPTAGSLAVCAARDDSLVDKPRLNISGTKRPGSLRAFRDRAGIPARSGIALPREQRPLS